MEQFNFRPETRDTVQVNLARRSELSETRPAQSSRGPFLPVIYESWQAIESQAAASTLPPQSVNQTASATFTVNDQSDAVDNSIGDGVCLATNGKCTLRAAIQEANAQYAAHGGFYTVTVPGALGLGLPPRVYALTLSGSGEDNAATGDLDIKCNLFLHTSNGLPALVNAAGLGDRAFQIMSPDGIPVSVSFANIGIENGSGTDEGGGLLIKPNANVTLSSASIMSNTVFGQFPKGGGIVNEDHSSLTLNNVLMQNNKVLITNDGSGGGGAISTFGNLSVNQSRFINNLVSYNSPEAPVSAAGGAINAFCCSGPVVLTASVVQSNSVTAAGTNQSGTGGGISASAVPLTITGSTINANVVTGGTGVLLVEGGGLYSDSLLHVENSVLDYNVISTTNGATYLDGGGMTLNGTAQIISDTLVANSVHNGSSFGGYGGGISLGGLFFGANVLVDRSVLITNLANDGGGLNTYISTTLAVRNSSLEGNVATNGAGIFNLGVLNLTNSTFYINSAAKSGGGLYDSGTANVDSATFFNNIADFDADNIGDGGGLFVGSGATLLLRNSLLTGDVDDTVSGAVLPDCVGTIISQDYNLIEQSPSVSGCNVIGATGHDRHGAFPGVLDSMPQDNGGSTPTIALPPGSVAINGGDPTGCKDENGSPLTIDQRGLPRVGPCDIGAYEYVLRNFLPLVLKNN
jgi:CSLREA domain-containing protein